MSQISSHIVYHLRNSMLLRAIRPESGSACFPLRGLLLVAKLNMFAHNLLRPE